MPPRESPPPQFSEDRPLVVNRNNIAIPLWLSVSMTGAFVSATIYFMTLLNQINGKIDNLGRDRWKLSYQRAWVNDFERINPTIKLPDADAIPRRIDP